MPKTSTAMLKAINKYQKEKIDEIKVRVPKGKKDEIKNYAQQQGKSLNGFINEAIDEKMERDKEKD